MKERDRGRLLENVYAAIGAAGATLIIIPFGVSDATRLFLVAAGVGVIGTAAFAKRFGSMQNKK